MRLSSLALLLGASTLGATQKNAAAHDKVEAEGTTFDGQRVPPVLELNPDNFNEVTKGTKNVVIKYFSPYCPHCIDFAPTYQTLYEFYTTSSIPDEPAYTTFEKFYDIKWAELNCIAYGDLCDKHRIVSYPQTSVWVDGEYYKSVQGGKNISTISNLIESVLEEQKPGSRPKNLVLPEPGADHSPSPEEAAEKTDKAKNDKVELADGSAQTDKVEKPGKDTEATKVTPYKAETTKKAKPTATPNPQGISVSLSAESFQQLVTMTQEPWFIKFYAPWCHHCQAMASNWQQLAKEMKGKLNIGEVNCDVESRLCKDVRVSGYPSIIFFKGGERVEYQGLRGLGDFVNYAEKALDICDGVQDVDAASLAELEEKEEVVFVYFYDHATASEDFMALERLPLSLIGRAKLVKTRDPALYDRFKISTWPRLLVSREGRPTYYTPLTPNEMRNTHQVLTWMKSVWLPIVPELTASNAREIMDGKIVVLGILNREDEESFLGAIREMKTAANEWMDKQIQLFQLERQNLRDSKQLRIEEAEDRNDQRALRAAKSIRISMDMSDRKEVAFAWVDGVFWQRWIRTTYGVDVKDGERVIINDEDNRRYWDTTITGNYIIPSRTSILETISKVTASPPEIKPKLTISAIEKVFFDIRMTFTEHPYLSGGCVLGLALGFFSLFRGRVARSRNRSNTAFRLEDNLPIKEIREGLLGNTANGKTD